MVWYRKGKERTSGREEARLLVTAKRGFYIGKRRTGYKPGITSLTSFGLECLQHPFPLLVVLRNEGVNGGVYDDACDRIRAGTKSSV